MSSIIVSNPILSKNIEESSAKEILLPALQKMESVIRIADLSKSYEEWKYSHIDNAMKILHVALCNSIYSGFDAVLNKTITSIENNHTTQICEVSHKWYIHAFDYDIMENLKTYGKMLFLKIVMQYIWILLILNRYSL